MVTQWEYEFDPYGDNQNNKIVDELHTIAPANGTDFSFFIPRKSPFHRRSMVVKESQSGAVLNIGRDYYFGWRYDDIITSGSVQPVYGAIVMNDPTKAYSVSITYQTVGGPTVLDDQSIATLLANTLRDPRRALWSDVVDVPTELPPIPHRQSTSDLVGFDSQIEAIYKLAAAIGDGNVKAMQAVMEHVADHHNPHHITLSDLGIDELGNMVPATKEEAEASEDNQHYMTALRTKQFSTANIIPIIDQHIDDTSNPHNVTAEQVGLGSVENYSVASSIDAESAVATNRYMTPNTTRILMEKNLTPLITRHTEDTTNPHKVTAEQVGLGSVQNYPLATSQEAGEATAKDRYMTPYLTSLAISAQVRNDIEFHTEDKDNPHKVTAEQVGLGLVQNYGLASLPAALSGKSNESYMSPYLTNQLILSKLSDAGVGETVTKETVGLGLVENYAPATNEQMKSLEGTRYVTTSGLFSFFGVDGGHENYIDANTVGLGNVSNYPISSKADWAIRSDASYITPFGVDKMMSELLISNPLLTSTAIEEIPAVGYPLISGDSDSVQGMKEGMVVSYEVGDIKGEGRAFFYKSYSIDDKYSVTQKLTRLPETPDVTFLVVNLVTEDDIDDYLFHLRIQDNRAQFVCFLVGETIEIGDVVDLPVVPENDTLAVTVSIDKTTGNIDAVLRYSENALTLSTTVDTLLASVSYQAEENEDKAIEVRGSWGFSVLANQEDLSTNGVVFTSDPLPPIDDGVLYRVDTKIKYTLKEGKWVESSGRLYYRPSATYWNPLTDELFLAVTAQHVIPYGMMSTV